MVNLEGSSVNPRKSSFLPLFPLELWDIIIGYLRNRESPQSLSRLAQTCPALHARIEPLLYESAVQLDNSESGARLARTIQSRPELAPLIREIQHKADTGFEAPSNRHFLFYQMAVTLPKLEKLFLKRNLPPLDTSRWASEAERAAAYTDWITKKEPKDLKELREFRLGSSSESSFSPPNNEKLTFPGGLGRIKSLFWCSLFQNPIGLPALRVCHIGCDEDLSDPNRRTRQPNFDETIFQHPGLRKLCITGSIFHTSSPHPADIPSRKTALEDLTLLNCDIEMMSLPWLLEFPKALKRFTFRGPLPEPLPEDLAWQQIESPVEAVEKHNASLEFMDYDVYWGHEDEIDLNIFENLKHLTITLSTLVGRECHELDVEVPSLPESLETLTLRYDESKAWVLSAFLELVKSSKLPNLRRFSCEVPETIESMPSINQHKKNPPCLEICQEGNTWQEEFKGVNVELSMVPVPYPLTVPKYELCTCECLEFYHRMPFHPHDDELALPWEDDEFNDDPWGDTDMDEAFEEVMSDYDGGDASDISD